MSDFGLKMRKDILLQAALREIVSPLQQHGWTAEVAMTDGGGQYVVISATRNSYSRRIALLYSSSTDNRIYRHLETISDIIFFNGEPYNLDQHTQGLSRPVFPILEFQSQLIEWNRESIPGKVVPSTLEATVNAPKMHRERRLISENPIDAVWSRLSRLQSASLARKAVAERAEAESFKLSSAAAALKGDGVSYAIRNATEYFSVRGAGSVGQRVLSLYYGCLSFAFAEILAAPNGLSELSRIEDVTKLGHGLWTLDGLEDGFGKMAVGPLSSGFFSFWAKSYCKSAIPTIHKRPKVASELLTAPVASWTTIEELFARIPEVGDLFEDIFEGSPAWVTPVYDQKSNNPVGLLRGAAKPKTSYILLIDDSGRITTDQLSLISGPIREITKINSGSRAGHFRAAVDHPDFDVWWKALKLHHSPFERNALIQPLYGCIEDYRSFCFIILYALSILVRYRVGLWRRIQEGDLDHLRALIEAFLNVVERILPEQFLESVTRERISIHQPGSFFA